MSDWQDISTAPKDGSELMGCHVPSYGGIPIGPWTMRFYDKRWIPSWDGYHVIDYQGDFGTDYKELDVQPTHWQPLPNPPKESK
jgi:Protein of unknown function (DUF551)